MTTTTHGPSKFPYKSVLIGLAAAALVLLVIGISQWSESDTQPLAATPSEVQTEAETIEVIPNELTNKSGIESAEAGSITPAESREPPLAKIGSDPVIVTGQGSLYDALVAGKFGTDFAAYNPDAQYVLVDRSGQAVEGWDVPTPVRAAIVSEPQFGPETVLVTGQGSLYDALVVGKFDTDFGQETLYVLRSESPNQLWTAYASGRIPEGWEDAETTATVSAYVDRNLPSGGHQE